jgi:hypothetical protein
MFADDGRCAGVDSLKGKGRAVGLVAGDGDEHEARLHLAAVGGHAGDVDGGQARIDSGIRQ